MDAIEFKEQNTIIAKDQPQYKPIPALRNLEGDLTMCFELSEEEIKEISRTGKLWLAVRTFHNPLQPMYLSTKKSDLFEGSEPEPDRVVEKVEPEKQTKETLIAELLEKGFVFESEQDGIFQQYVKKIGDLGKELVFAITPLTEIFVWIPEDHNSDEGDSFEDGVKIVLDVETIDKAIEAAEAIAGIDEGF